MNGNELQLKMYSEEIIDSYISPIKKIINYVIEKTGLHGDTPVVNTSLTSEELHSVAIALSALCVELQEKIEKMNFDQSGFHNNSLICDVYQKDTTILYRAHPSGTNKKGLDSKFDNMNSVKADNSLEFRSIQDLFTTQIINSLKSYVLRVDKFCEYLVKIIDKK